MPKLVRNKKQKEQDATRADLRSFLREQIKARSKSFPAWALDDFEDALAAVRTLRTCDHDCLKEAYAAKLAARVGVVAKMRAIGEHELQEDVKKGTVGVSADELAEQICRHRHVAYEFKYGRGSGLRECCDKLIAFFEGNMNEWKRLNEGKFLDECKPDAVPRDSVPVVEGAPVVGQ